jgi:S-phase kinase-associated protein 1
MSKNITIISSDGQNITIDEKSAKRSNLLNGVLLDFKEDSEVPTPSVRGEVIKKVVEYLTHYMESEPKKIPKPLPSTNLLDVTDEWDVTFINSLDLDFTYEIVNAANYMEINSLLDLACAKLAALMTGRTEEEIREMFNIENDLSPEELKEYEEYIN